MSLSTTTTVLISLTDRHDSCLVHALGRTLVEVIDGEPKLSVGVTLHDGELGPVFDVGSCQTIGRNRVVIEVHGVPVVLAEAEGYAALGVHRPRMTEEWAAAVERRHSAS